MHIILIFPFTVHKASFCLRIMNNRKKSLDCLPISLECSKIIILFQEYIKTHPQTHSSKLDGTIL